MVLKFDKLQRAEVPLYIYTKVNRWEQSLRHDLVHSYIKSLIYEWKSTNLELQFVYAHINEFENGVCKLLSIFSPSRCVQLSSSVHLATTPTSVGL